MAWLTGWSYRKKITVQTAFLEDNLSAFPLYVKLASEAQIGSGALATGYDIRFTQSDGTTLLYYDRESWTGGGGDPATADFWVNTNLSTAGTDIYVYYGKADAEDGNNPTAVRDENFKGVWHSKDASTTTIADSTTNANTGTKKGVGEPLEATGQVGNAQQYDGVDDNVNCGSGSSLAITGAITISAWIKSNIAIVSSTAEKVIATRRLGVGADRYGFGLAFSSNVGENTGTLDFYIGKGVGGQGWYTPAKTTQNSWNADQWYHVVFTKSAVNAFQYYIIGQPENSGTSYNIPYYGSENYTIGLSAFTFSGLLDEVRISNVARSAPWIKFEFNNVAQDDNELTWAGQETSEEPANTGAFFRLF